MTFNVTKEPGKDKLTLNAVLNQRSQDILAANNWNVCQYSILLMMIAQVCGLEAGELVHVRPGNPGVSASLVESEDIFLPCEQLLDAV